MKIFLALTDDWELRGNGSGDLEELQFAPLKRLLTIYERFGVRGTVNAEVLQQLTFRKFQDKFPELRPLADAWDDSIRDAFSRGHDVQLHIHPQWSNAEFANSTWQLKGDWSILKYSPEAAFKMLVEAKEYLENLLRPLDPAYKCVAFRSGSSCIAPSDFALKQLAQLGIVFDMSIVGGLHINTRNVQLDYTECDETFLPYYPNLADARKLSDKNEQIVCVPIFQFQLSRSEAVKEVFTKSLAKAKGAVNRSRINIDSAYANNEWSEIGQSSPFVKVYKKAIKPSLSGKHSVGDLSKLNLTALREMVRSIRSKAVAAGASNVPVLLTNHSKYISDFSHIEGFLEETSSQPDIEYLTLSDVAKRLQAGEFPIRRKL